MDKKPVTFSEAKAKAEKYCAYQERSHKEVEAKLRTFRLKESEITDILIHLVQKNFLNEERFAIAFAGGKYRVLGWGRKKIIYQLRQKGINDKLIQVALKEIPESDYGRTIETTIQKKDAQFKSLERYKRMAKMHQFLSGKGFENELIFEALKKFYKE